MNDSFIGFNYNKQVNDCKKSVISKRFFTDITIYWCNRDCKGA